MTRFLIKKNGTYYLTTGTLLEYNPANAHSDQQRAGVAEVERTFERIRNEPHTWYESVEVTQANFGPMNTGQSS
jgi:hypothetical protein